MEASAEEMIREFLASAYARIDGMVQVHCAADADGKQVIEDHIAEILEEIMAALALAELLDLVV